LNAASRCSSPSTATNTSPSAQRARPQDAEPLAIAGGRAQGQRGGAVGIVVIVSLGGVPVLAPSEPGERGVDLRLAQPGHAGTRRPVGWEGGQAVLHVAVLLAVNGDDRFEAGAGVGIEFTPGDDLAGEAPGLSRVQAWTGATRAPWLISSF
jgi:hypothetical protein